MSRICLVFIVATGLLLHVSGAQALSVSLGANLARHELAIVEKDNTDSRAAQFISSFYVSPAIHINTSESYFGSSRLGWKVILNVGTMDMDTQVVDGAEKNIGTRMTGVFSHFNPTVFYRFGDKRAKGRRHWRLTAGLGYGFSYLMIDGNALTTEVPEEQKRIISVDKAQGLFLLPATLFEASWYNWYAQISACFGGSGFVVDDYNYQLLFRSVSVGYAFDF